MTAGNIFGFFLPLIAALSLQLREWALKLGVVGAMGPGESSAKIILFWIAAIGGGLGIAKQLLDIFLTIRRARRADATPAPAVVEPKGPSHG